MTTKEFSNEFDTLVNSYSRYKDFDDKENLDSIEFNEYEKSVYLTFAQEELLREYYAGKNIFLDSFEKTEEIRRYLSSLVYTYNSTQEITLSGTLIPLSATMSKFFNIPQEVWYITYEQVKFNDTTLGCLDGTNGGIVPVTLDDFWRTMRNPFRGPSKKRVLRLDITGNIVELVSKYAISEYTLRYVALPEPIILEDLPNNLTINNNNLKTECSLHPALHRVILERAVQNALRSKSINSKAS